MKRFAIALGTVALVLMLLTASQGFAAPTTAAIAAATLGPAAPAFHGHHGHHGHHGQWTPSHYPVYRSPHYCGTPAVVVVPRYPVPTYSGYYGTQSGFYYNGPRLSIGVGF